MGGVVIGVFAGSDARALDGLTVMISSEGWLISDGHDTAIIVATLHFRSL